MFIYGLWPEIKLYYIIIITFRFTTIAYIIMTMRVFIRNIAGGDSSR